MINARTRGQDRAVAEIGAMIRGRVPHAVLLVGPGSVGKTTLALDLAAGLLCQAPGPADRPCRECRGCRMVASGNHPDLHRLVPEGPGGQVRIGRPENPEPGTVRHLIGEIALLPVEGGARVAIVEQAHRLNDDAQNALLKLLEEPPSGATLILCTDDEECLLPTVRSRCVRVRVTAVAIRELERWLVEQGLADTPRAARLARLAGGRPGLALAYARSADAERIRGEVARGIVDMLSLGRQQRLSLVRDLLKSTLNLRAALDSGRAEPGRLEIDAAPSRGRRRSVEPAPSDGPAGPADPADGSAEAPESNGGKASVSDRRAAATALLEIWAEVGRDVIVAGAGSPRQLRQLELLDEVRAAARGVSPEAMRGFLARLTTVAAALDDNVNPELALDVLALSWPCVDDAGSQDTPSGTPPRAAARSAP